ncbi:MAG: glycosyltransferase family 4 protein [Phycisphaerales bacterium]|nr:glycosyltransferase family 4 protein [Phycisphaerales bacterium]
MSGRQDIARIGGAEVQQTLVARAMVERGFRVRFVSRDHGQADGIDHGGVQVFKMCGPDDGLPGLRFIHPRWTSLIGALRRAAADVYYQRAAGVETGQVAMWCRANGRAFVFAAAVDDDCTPSLPLLRGDLRAKWLYRYGLNRAHRVIGQTRTQISLLRESFGIEATLIRSCSADPLEGEPAKRQRSVDNSAVILWVGRLAEQKRPDRLLDLAEACPTLKFEVVGAANANSRYAQEVQSRGQRLPNVAMRGWVPHESMGDYYSRAALLVCTSDSEGYPNTFMEAWARGLPTVSTVDPDGVVATNGLGAIGPDVASLAGGVRRLLENGCEWQACSQRARRFFLDHHTVTACADAYERLLSELPLGRCPARGVAPKPTVQT